MHHRDGMQPLLFLQISNTQHHRGADQYQVTVKSAPGAGPTAVEIDMSLHTVASEASSVEVESSVHIVEETSML